MKRIVIITSVILVYFLFLLFMLAPSGGHHEEGGMYGIVVGHLTDHPIAPVAVLPGDNIVIRQLKGINNFIAIDLNERILKNYQINISGLPNSDLRITRWVLMLWVSVLMSALIFIPLGRMIKKDRYGSKSRWVNMWESLIGFVHDEIVEPNFDHKYIKTAMPYFSSVFFFILFCNLMGLVPGASTATGNLAVTGGLAIFTLLGMFAVGFVKQGPLWIVTGIVPHGIPVFLFPMLWAIELVGLLIKPFALTVRLFANMTAGHIVIIIFLYLIMMFESYFVGIASVAGSLMIFLLELLVAFIQAYIFAVLSAMFIGSSMHAH
ncbi:MAG: F0F1 ATP synthase subunit A [Spirochaetes bacterium]|nr:F0F1 ATP synthase subunit A [Spirochaetota bacterium]